MHSHSPYPPPHLSRYLPMADTRNSLQGVKPHKDYWLSGGDLHLIVEDREFRVHRYFFERDSAKFRALLAAPSPGKPQQGSSHLTAIKLHNVTATDFETFLWVFYNPTYSLYNATVADWSCILHLGNEWQFAEVEKLAVRELEKMPMSAVDRIVLYQKHSVSEELLIPHYAALCVRGYPLNFDESNQLGMSTVVIINQAMHSLHKPAGKDSNVSPFQIDPTNAVIVSKIVAHIRNGEAGSPAGSGPPGNSPPDGNFSSTNGIPKKASNGVNGTDANKSGQSTARN
ncbi:hypothetical protein DFH07DRAFT_860139 [Mycena maculata]|uniref:BTB domain-containing protein n=1 Tax=Mycena maculata TaxID=230809 RepID=A0AAD7MI45_9AGAR|nr:hypothetical protein DFH07DRAFT_860139 [Mycena maculata]